MLNLRSVQMCRRLNFNISLTKKGRKKRSFRQRSRKDRDRKKLNWKSRRSLRLSKRLRKRPQGKDKKKKLKEKSAEKSNQLPSGVMLALKVPPRKKFRLQETRNLSKNQPLM